MPPPTPTARTMVRGTPTAGAGLALYVHIPFCDHRCAYCDFNAYAGLNDLMPAYTAALTREIRQWGELLGRVPLTTVFFGGGTPSLLPLPLLEDIIATIWVTFIVDSTVEITLEANPGTVTADYFARLPALGINRVSIGVQSFHDEELRRLDRIHDGDTARAAVQQALAAGLNVSLDLIYGLAGQDLAGWEANLATAIALGPHHLSLYALTVEEGTPLAHRVRTGVAPEPDPDLQADMYELAEARLAAAGYQQYELSNWARPGAACRHNLVYWRDGEWLGVGVGAHSHLRGHRFAVMNPPAGYVRRVTAAAPAVGPALTEYEGAVSGELVGRSDADRHTARLPTPPHAAQDMPAGAAEDRPAMRFPPTDAMPWITFAEPPDPALALADATIMRLRLNEGLPLADVRARFNVEFDDMFGPALVDVYAAGLLERTPDRVRLTARGRLLANEVFSRIMGVCRAGDDPLAIV